MKRKTKVLLICYGAALLVVFNAALLACHVGANGYRTRLDVHANRAFSEAFNALETLDESLQKLPFAADAAMENEVCTEIYGDAQRVETALSVLPVELDALEQISRHISTVGDFAGTLARSAAEGERIPEESKATLIDLTEITAKLHDDLGTLRQALNDGAVVPEHYSRLTDALDDLEHETETAADTLDAELHTLAADFKAVPAFMYDGVYSDHSGDRPLALEGKDEVSREQARRNAAAFLGCEAAALEPLDKAEGTIPCWRFRLAQNGETTVAVTVQGGEVLRVLASDQSSASGDSDAALRFLSDHGYSDMQPLSDEANRYAPVQESVFLLPDGVSLLLSGDGTVLHFDAEDYLMHHTQRDLSVFQSEPDLTSVLPEGVTVSDTRNVLLRSPGGQERPCAELTCTAEDGTVCVLDYHLETARQERIALSSEIP